jgi:putative nucleotidyltransferase with HDIG domain
MFADVSRTTPPPRFVVRTLLATLATVAFVLSAVLLAVTFSVRDHVRQSVIERLETGQRLLATLEARRAQDVRAQVAMLAESPTLKAVLDTYQAERRMASDSERAQLIATVARELDKIAARFDLDVLAAIGNDDAMLAVSGRLAAAWAAQADPAAADQTFRALQSGLFRVVTIPVMLQGSPLGRLQVAQALDARYATELSALSGARSLIVADGRVLATTLPAETAAMLTPERMATLADGELTSLAGSEFAVRPLFREGGAAIYVLDSIEAAARPLLRSSLRTLAFIALGAFGLAGIASLWLARTISRPIDTLSTSLAEMTRAGAFDRPLPASRDSLEVDALTTSFNTMMEAIREAEAETLSAYLEAIKALAMALDARDPYTAGHAERVSALSVAIGRKMGLDDPTLEVLRLGALLHDIGKIGISDDVLRKAGPLTPDEYDVIKRHPTVGSRILRSVRFLEPHLPIVELHHERPDGSGYPNGLRGDAIPILARIVHVADAFDAITSARAYRPARDFAAGIAELRRCAGNEFDADVVRALASALRLDEASDLDAFPPAIPPSRASEPDGVDTRATQSSDLDAFPTEVAPASSDRSGGDRTAPTVGSGRVA